MLKFRLAKLFAATVCTILFVSSAYAIDPPDEVVGPNLSINGSYQLSWELVPGASSYAVFEAINAGSYSLVQIDATRQFNPSGNSNGNYHYVVAACTTSQCSGFTPQHTVSVGLYSPGYVAGLTYVESDQTFILRWQEVGGATIYPLYRQINGGSFQLVDIPNDRSITFRNQQVGTHNFSVGVCDATQCAASTSPILTVEINSDSQDLSVVPTGSEFNVPYVAHMIDYDGNGMSNANVDFYIRQESDIIVGAPTSNTAIDSAILRRLSNGQWQVINSFNDSYWRAQTANMTPKHTVGSGDLNADSKNDLFIASPVDGNTILFPEAYLFSPSNGSSIPSGVQRNTGALEYFSAQLSEQLINPSFAASRISSYVVCYPSQPVGYYDPFQYEDDDYNDYGLGFEFFVEFGGIPPQCVSYFDTGAVHPVLWAILTGEVSPVEAIGTMFDKGPMPEPDVEVKDKVSGKIKAKTPVAVALLILYKCATDPDSCTDYVDEAIILGELIITDLPQDPEQDTMEQSQRRRDADIDVIEKEHPVYAEVFSTYTLRGKQKQFCTYRVTRNNSDVYSGRTSGLASLLGSSLINRRWGNHWALKLVMGSSANINIDVCDTSYGAIRGREQQLIDFTYGIPTRQGSPGKTINKIRGVSRINPKGCTYHQTSNFLFGPLYSYTGVGTCL